MSLKRKLILVVFIIILFIMLNMAFTYKPIVYINNKTITCFKFSIINHNFLGLWNKNLPIKVKIANNSNYNHNIIGVMNQENGKYLITQSNNIIYLYDLKGTLIETHDIGASNEKIVSTAIADLDKNNQDELLVITGDIHSEYGSRLRLCQFNGKLIESFSQDFGDMKPWKVQTADVDGDGKQEISIGMYKTAVFHDVMAKRPYIYNWHGNAISPKWRGSRLSRPFTDYVFTDLDADGSDELIAIETLEDGRKLINSYKWKGFGVEGFSYSDSFEDVLEIRLHPSDKNLIYANVKKGRAIKWIVLALEDNKLTVIKELAKYVPEI